VVHLSEQEREQFAQWFEQLEEEVWDRQMERDFAPGGRGAPLVQSVDMAIDRAMDAGSTAGSLEDGLCARRTQR
ncbi:MAG: hypothetical protein FJW31_13765, partial [Acidobacteria bacterium]|nr:hypothetical protein [Acidobacteriota bacterium]